MEIQISDQAAVFCRSLLLGVSLGLVYDLLRCLRGLLHRRGTALTDGAYSFIVLAAVFYFAMAFGRGLLRIYMVLGIGMGLVLFFALLSRPLRPLWDYWRDSLSLVLRILLAPAAGLAALLKKLGGRQKSSFLFWKSGLQ